MDRASKHCVVEIPSAGSLVNTDRDQSNLSSKIYKTCMVYNSNVKPAVIEALLARKHSVRQIKRPDVIKRRVVKSSRNAFKSQCENVQTNVSDFFTVHDSQSNSNSSQHLCVPGLSVERINDQIEKHTSNNTKLSWTLSSLMIMVTLQKTQIMICICNMMQNILGWRRNLWLQYSMHTDGVVL